MERPVLDQGMMSAGDVHVASAPTAFLAATRRFPSPTVRADDIWEGLMTVSAAAGRVSAVP